MCKSCLILMENDGIICSESGGYMMGRKPCVLYDRECIECGECNVCDLDPGKVCDNCGRCIGLGDGANGPQYRAIKVDGIIDESIEMGDYIYDEDMLDPTEVEALEQAFLRQARK